MKMSLPEDIQNEILLRADVKTLIRLKAGCKSWNSLVKDPSFISKHMTLQKSSKILLAPGSGESSSSFNSITNFPSVNFVDICSPTDDVVEYIYDSIQFSHTARILTQSCRGLFLVGYYNRNKLEIPQHLAIVNPATKEKRVLPQSDLFHPVSGIAPKVMLYGLGYDSQTNDYGVVRLFDVRLFDMVDQSVTIAELYSMRSNSWREVDIGTAISNVLPLHDASQYSVYAAGSSHWFLGWSRGIMSFDFRTRMFRVARLPLRLTTEHYKNFYILPRNYVDDDDSITLVIVPGI